MRAWLSTISLPYIVIYISVMSMENNVSDNVSSELFSMS